MEREPIKDVRQQFAGALSSVIRQAVEQPISSILPSMSKERVESVFKEGAKHQERHLIVSDYQIPDYNKKAHSLVLDFIDDFKPSHLEINGDFLNFTPFSRYDVIAGKQPPPIKEELKIGRKILGELVERVRKNNPQAQVIWLQGNHESRLEKFIIRQALGSHSPLIDLEVDGEEVLSIPHLFKLKELGVEWVPERKSKKYHGFYIEHGDIARKHGGYTAQAMIDRKGSSGVSSHTHRLALVGRTNATKTMYWIESGSMCNSRPSPQYAKDADWQRGFGVMIFDRRTKKVYPCAVPIINNSFTFGTKLYK